MFKCFHCQKEIEGHPFKIPVEMKLPDGTVKIEGESKPTIFQMIGKFCMMCARPHQQVNVHRRTQ